MAQRKDRNSGSPLSTSIPIIFLMAFLPLFLRYSLLIFYAVTEEKVDRRQISVLVKAQDFGKLVLFRYCF